MTQSTFVKWIVESNKKSEHYAMFVEKKSEFLTSSTADGICSLHLNTTHINREKISIKQPYLFIFSFLCWQTIY